MKKKLFIILQLIVCNIIYSQTFTTVISGSSTSPTGRAPQGSMRYIRNLWLITAAEMAASLKTNTKYLSFILKKYRGNDFYNYLNEMRINYIVKALYEDPKLLKYKISVLSDMCGYNTHSQFASAFKQIKDITPSQFITNLKNEKRL